MFQSPYGDYLVRNLIVTGRRGYEIAFQSPYGDYLVRNAAITNPVTPDTASFSPLTGIT